MYGLCVLSNYVFFLAVVPMLAHCDCFRNYILPRLAHLLHLSKVPVEQHLLAVGLVTILVYFLLNLTLDVIQTIRTLSSVCRQRRVSTRTTSTSTSTSITTKKTTTTQSTSRPVLDGSEALFPRDTPTCHITMGLHRAHQQLVHYYPAFVASTFLIWANTNRFDTFSIAFVMIQVMFLFLLPFSYACPHPLINHLNRIAYQCALVWTVAYAIYPRDVAYVLDRSANDIYAFFSPAPTDIYYTPIL